MLPRQQRGVFLNRVSIIALVAVLSVVLVLADLVLDDALTDAQSESYQLTIRNITARQPISPPIVVVHESNAVLLPKSAGRLEGLEEFAESGAQPVLMESLSSRSRVKSVARFGGVLQPNSQQTLLRLEAEPGDHISILGMLTCTNDAIVVGTAVLTDPASPAFGSGVVWDVGTEENDESRATVPCLDGEGVSNPDTADGEGTIERHPGLNGNADLGDVFKWDRTVLEIVVDARGKQPRRAFEVGATFKNETLGQPITPPVVVVHDKNVDVLSYTRPRELPGIDRLSEGGDGSMLLDTLSERPGVVSVRQWHTGGPILPGESIRNNARAFIGTTVSVLGMFACTNDGYVVVSTDVTGSTVRVTHTPSTATVFDSGAENNDETTATVPCLGGDGAAFSEGPGENGRREHPGIEGVGDLDPNVHGWDADTIASLRLHAAVEVDPTPIVVATTEPVVMPTMDPGPVETPEAIPPDTGGRAPATNLTYVLLFASFTLLIAGIGVIVHSSRRRNARYR